MNILFGLKINTACGNKKIVLLTYKSKYKYYIKNKLIYIWWRFDEINLDKIQGANVKAWCLNEIKSNWKHKQLWVIWPDENSGPNSLLYFVS